MISVRSTLPTPCKGGEEQAAWGTREIPEGSHFVLGAGGSERLGTETGAPKCKLYLSTFSFRVPLLLPPPTPEEEKQQYKHLAFGSTYFIVQLLTFIYSVGQVHASRL